MRVVADGTPAGPERSGPRGVRFVVAVSHYGGVAQTGYVESILGARRAGISTYHVRGCAYPEMARCVAIREALDNIPDAEAVVLVDPSIGAFSVDEVATLALSAVRRSSIELQRGVSFSAFSKHAIKSLYANEASAVSSGFDDDRKVVPIASPWRHDKNNLVPTPLVESSYLTPDEAIIHRARELGIPVYGSTSGAPAVKLTVRPGDAAKRERYRLPNYAICGLNFGGVDLDQQALLWELEKAGHTILELSDHPYIDRGRSILTREALLRGVDGVFFLDHDIIFRIRDLVNLEREAERRQEMVAAAYCMRRTGKAIIGAIQAESGEEVTFFKGGSPTSAVYAGLGFAAIPRSTITKLMDRLPLLEGLSPLYALDATGTFYSGEDVSFCARVRGLIEQKVWIDTSVRVFHRGSYDYGIEDSVLGVPRYETAIAKAFDSRSEVRNHFRHVDQLPIEAQLRAVGLDEGATVPHEGFA